LPSGTVSPLTSAPLIIKPMPPVSPEARLIAPGEDGPKVVPNELSLIAKCWA
jgi:hypothetical protein